MSTTIKPRTGEIPPIYQGDDLERLTELKREVDDAELRVLRAEREAAGAPRRGGDEDPVAEAKREWRAKQDAFDAFVDEATERAVFVRVQSIGSRRFRDLMRDHPPRRVKVKKVDGDGVEREVEEDHEDDASWAINTETFPLALLTFADGVKQTIVEPKMSPGQLRDFLDDEVDDGPLDAMWQTAYMMNRARGADPKAMRYSPASLNSDET